MLTKLKRKFILINMVLVGAVLVFVFALICLNVYQTQKDAVDKSLYSGLVQLNYPYSDLPDMPNDSSMQDRFNSDSQSVAVTAVTLNSTATTGGNYIIMQRQSINFSMDDTLLIAAIDKVLEEGLSEGHIKSMNLFYLRSDDDGSIKIAFADGSRLHQTVKNTISVAALIFALSMMGLFFISVLLSTIAISPVKKAWTQQRQFVADASHELKTPLTVILANDNILLSHPDEPIENQKQWIESTDAEARHMHKLVEDMLFLAKSDAATSPLEIKLENISDLTWSTFLQFEPVAYERGVTLSSDIQGNVCLLTDASKTKQLLHILMDNACKYAEKGGEAKISLTGIKDKVRISVHNTGRPISPEDLPHIFERFYRADKARTIGDGYGLGLSIARSIVEQLGGNISVTSSESEGTTFTVILPKVKNKTNDKRSGRKRFRRKNKKKDLKENSRPSFRDDELLS